MILIIKKLIKLSKYKRVSSKFVEILDNQLSHDKIAQEVFKSSFETKKIISKNLVYKNYYFLKKIYLSNFFLKITKKNLYLKTKFQKI